MTASSPEVPAADRESVDRAAGEVRRALTAGDVDAALVAMDQAWAALPEPKLQWDFYPQVLSRTFADQLARAGRGEDAVRWLRVTRQAYDAPEVGDQVPIDLIDARIRLGLGRREEAVRILAGILDAYGRRPFTGDNADLLPIAESGGAGPGSSNDAQSPLAAGIPDAEGGAATERADLDAEIERLSELGSQAMDDDDVDTAVQRWTEALEVLPAPRSEWGAATWLYTAIGDAFYGAGRLDEALESFRQAMMCPDARGSGFLLLRLGQALVDGDVTDEGVQALLGAYMLEGAEIFDGEDPRYLGLLRERDLLAEPGTR